MTVTMLGSSEKHHRPPTSVRFSNATTVNPSSSMYLHAIRPDQPAPITITSVKFLFPWGILYSATEEKGIGRNVALWERTSEVKWMISQNLPSLVQMFLVWKSYEKIKKSYHKHSCIYTYRPRCFLSLHNKHTLHSDTLCFLTDGGCTGRILKCDFLAYLKRQLTSDQPEFTRLWKANQFIRNFQIIFFYFQGLKMALTYRLLVSGQIEFSKNILPDGALVFAWYFWFMSVPLIHANTKYNTSNLIWSFAFAAVYFSIKKYF